MYKDIELKTRYHKERIIQSFIKNGIYPDNKLIQIKLENIETRLSIFKNPNFKEGTYINANILNNAILEIYNDLRILYELLYEVTVKKYNNLSYYIESHMRELDATTEMYIKKANLESISTVISTPILFKHNNFIIDKTELSSIIQLGKADIKDNSSVICIADTNNIDHKNIAFKFINGETILNCNSYSNNHEMITFPGESNINEYLININSSQNINGLLELPATASNVEGSKFITMAGKDKILYKKANEDGDIIEERPIVINSLNFDSHSYIDFYVVGGNNISFRFNKKPLATNFNVINNNIKNLNYIEHFFIECDQGFSFDFELDKGAIYAIKENTIIKNNSFYYSGIIPINDFMLIHYLPNESKEYVIEMHVANADITVDNINSIMIKKTN